MKARIKMNSNHNTRKAINLSLAKVSRPGVVTQNFESSQVSIHQLQSIFTNNNYSPIKWVGGYKSNEKLPAK